MYREPERSRGAAVEGARDWLDEERAEVDAEGRAEEEEEEEGAAGLAAEEEEDEEEEEEEEEEAAAAAAAAADEDDMIREDEFWREKLVEHYLADSPVMKSNSDLSAKNRKLLLPGVQEQLKY